MFNIENSADYYAMLVADFDDFMEEPQSARRAIHCAITAYHLAEWVWHDWLGKDEKARNAIGVMSENSFYAYLNGHVWLNILREIANGSKHFKRQVFKTKLVSGYGSGQLGKGPFRASYLLIDLGDAESEETELAYEQTAPAAEMRYLVAADLLEVVVRFWRDFFKKYRPDITVQSSKHHNL